MGSVESKTKKKWCDKRVSYNCTIDLLSSVVIVIASIAILGWIFSLPHLVQVDVDYAPMQFNTVLCFILTSVAVLFLKRMSWLASIASTAAIILAFGTLLQTIFGINFGVDTVSGFTAITTHTEVAGRMSNFTSINFTLLNLIVLRLSTLNERFTHISFVAAIFVFIVAVISATGYLTQLYSQPLWYEINSMAVNTTVNFLLLSIAIIIILILESDFFVKSNFYLPAVYLFFTLALIFFGVFLSISTNDYLQHKNKVFIKMDFLSSQVKEKITSLQIEHGLLGSIVEKNHVEQKDLLPIKNLFDRHKYISALAFVKNNKDYDFYESKYYSVRQSRFLISECLQQINPAFIPAEFQEASFRTVILDSTNICKHSIRNNLIILIDMNSLFKSILRENTLHGAFELILLDDPVSTLNPTKNNQLFQTYNIRIAGSSDIISYKLYETLEYNFRISAATWSVLILGWLFSLLLALLLVFTRLHLAERARLGIVIKDAAEKEELYDRIISAAQNGLMLVSSEGKITLANNVAEQLTGYSLKQLQKLSIEDLMPLSDRSKHKVLRHKYNRSPSPRYMNNSLTVQLLRKDGSIVLVDVSLSPVIFQNEQLTICNIVDKSSQIHNELVLLNKAKNIRLLHDVNSAISEVSNTEEALSISLRLICNVHDWALGHVYLYRQIGRKVEDGVLESRNIWFTNHPGRFSEFMKYTNDTNLNFGEDVPGKAIKDRESIIIFNIKEYSNNCRAKQYLDSAGFISLFSFGVYKYGKPVAVFELFSTTEHTFDLEQKQTYEIIAQQLGRAFERQDAQKQLTDKEKQLRLFLSSAAEGIIGYDQNFQISYINKSALSILRCHSERSSVGNDVRELFVQFLKAPEIINIIEPAIKEAILTGNQKGEQELIFDQNPVYIKFSISPVISENKVIGAVIFFFDITESKSQQGKLESYSNLLKTSNEAMEEFVSIASHDLKEPLRGISSHASFLKDDLGDTITNTSKEKLKTIATLCQRIESLLDGLLQYSKVGTVIFSYTRADLDSLLKDRLSTIQDYLNLNNCTVKIKGQLPTIVCEGPKIIEVFYNFISNSIKYNNHNDKLIIISSIEHKEYWEFIIKDNGIGIDSENINKAFSIFKRLHAKHEFGGGSGIGLAITKKIVERHGGSINVDSEVGIGTTIRFTVNKMLNESENHD